MAKKNTAPESIPPEATGAAPIGSPPEIETNEPADIPPETAEELDEEEKEFRALRRDLDGVKGASAAGIVAISVSKTPAQERVFPHASQFRPIIKMVNLRGRDGAAILCRHGGHGRGARGHRHHR